jgi:hypothetical protein
VFFGIPEWAIGVGFIIVAGSLAKALTGGFTRSSRLRGRQLHPREIGPALEEMQRRLDALEEGQQQLGSGDDAQARLNEVEERLDFVERMLAKQRDAERVAPPKP